MRRVIGFLMLALSASMAANAGKTSANLYVESTRIFRGGVYNDDGVPFTKGQLTYSLDSGLFFTTFAENLLSQYNQKATDAAATTAGISRNYLFDFRQMNFSGLGYTIKSDAGWSLTPMVGFYYFPEKRQMDASDFMVFFKRGNLDAHISFMPRFFQWISTNQIYLSIDYEVVLDEGLSLLPHYGSSIYSNIDPRENTTGQIDKVLHRNYQDWSLALSHSSGGMKLDVGWAFTNRTLVNSNEEITADDRPFMRARFTF